MSHLMRSRLANRTNVTLRLARQRRASVSVEAALVISLVLLPLLLGLWDYSVVLSVQGRLDTALNAAMDYALATTANAADAQGIEQAANNAYGTAGPTPVIGTPTLSYYCISTNPAGTMANGQAASAGASCGSNQTLATYVTLSLAATVSLPLTIPGVGDTFPLGDNATIRVE